MKKYYKIQYVVEVGSISRTYMAVTDSLITFINVLIEKGESSLKQREKDIQDSLVPSAVIQPRIIDVSEIDEELYKILDVCPIVI